MRRPLVSTIVPTTPPPSAPQIVTMRAPSSLLRIRNRVGGADEGEMSESLGEVAEELPALGVDLLRVETDVVREPDELVHQPPSLFQPSQSREGVDEPERAGEESALLAHDAVLAAIAVDERPFPQLALDRRH